MNKTGIVIILLCFLAAAAVVLWERRKARKTMEEIERMLDAAMTGSFSETNFDESQLSALETKFAHYLSAAEASSQNIAQEKDKIKTLIADISHQTKTPIANLLLYSELLMSGLFDNRLDFVDNGKLRCKLRHGTYPYFK